MTNRSKAKGTAAETAVVRFARENGFPLADRLTLSGRFDRGDILLCGGVIIEVKAHATFSDGDVILWLGEALREAENAGADYGFLVVKRPGKGVAQVAHWWAVEAEYDTGVARPTYRYLGDHLKRLSLRGYGAGGS